MLSKGAHAEIFDYAGKRADKDEQPGWTIAYALLCIHEVMQRQQELEAADDAQIEQIRWNIRSKQGSN